MLFISYSRVDVTETKILSGDLASKGVECWLDESNIPMGQAFVAKLGEALQRSDAFLMVDTPLSRRSHWVSREVKTAIRFRREGRSHTLARVYSPPCEGQVGSPWDNSFPLDTVACESLAELLAVRSTPRRVIAANADVSSVSIEGNGLGQPSNWSGRQDELRHLDEWWSEPARGAWIQGLGGNGKSGLVQTWITALGYLGYDEPVKAAVLYVPGREVVKLEDAVGRLKSWQLHAAHEGKLVFLDGYDEASPAADLEVLLQEALRLGCRAIITSRRQVPVPLVDRFRSINLSSMSRDDAPSMLSDFGSVRTVFPR
ncbi:TIR domain-containing protein [Candidatus Nitrospira neomarina]|uniref:TIR domain-containing protein n=1 Tax=Candidatus Nitrospira neomarina TaxID=3020899 RepID=UPI0035E3F18C